MLYRTVFQIIMLRDGRLHVVHTFGSTIELGIDSNLSNGGKRILYKPKYWGVKKKLGV